MWKQPALVRKSLRRSSNEERTSERAKKLIRLEEAWMYDTLTSTRTLSQIILEALPVEEKNEKEEADEFHDWVIMEESSDVDAPPQCTSYWNVLGFMRR